MSAAGTSSGQDQRSPSARLLVFGGISLILIGMLLGEVFAIFISHVASAQVRREWIRSVIPAIEQHDLAAMGAGYTRIEELLERRGRIMDTHSHIIAYGFLALALAALQPLNHHAERIRRALALCIVAGGLIQSVFVFVSYWATHQGRNWALISSSAGGTLVLVGVLGTLVGLRGTPVKSDFAAETSRLLSSASSQILLRTGAVLILVGMVFGFYYAWVFVTRQEPQQIGLLNAVRSAAMSRDSMAATKSITAYRLLQSRIAIVTAAHSHIIEMGVMAMLLAFAQNFVFLSDPWKRRWAVLFCIGAAVMPICTYIASILGLVPAGFADAFGMMSLVALFAMLCGLVRQTGTDESGYAP
ncbi:MAG TPA: hypothetical protein VEV41_04310 [Terriglobales bacterium]|nr:hypothetical protein [Terriglobales bacterium]